MIFTPNEKLSRSRALGVAIGCIDLVGHGLFIMRPHSDNFYRMDVL
jgi:hypothetical protein